MRFVNANWPKGKFLTILFSIGLLSMVLSMVAAQRGATATVFEGARLITGDGSAPIMDAAFVVDNGRFTAVGRKGQISVPAGAAHVYLTGKTVIPALIDAHKHLAVTRDALVDQLQHFAYYGVGVAMSMGQDTGDVAFQVRQETIPNAARNRPGSGPVRPRPAVRFRAALGIVSCRTWEATSPVSWPMLIATPAPEYAKCCH